MKTRRLRRNGKKTVRSFLFNPKNPSKSFDVYIDKNPKDTIPIKYTTVTDVKETIEKLERLKTKIYNKQIGLLSVARQTHKTVKHTEKDY